MQPTDTPVTGQMVTHAQAADDSATPARTLRAAAFYLARHGWVQGSYYDQTASVFTPAACVVGAIGMVCYGGPVEAPAQHSDEPGWVDFEAAVAYLDLFLSSRHGADSAYGFNDTPGRTVAQVVAALAETADDWDRRQGDDA